MTYASDDYLDRPLYDDIEEEARADRAEWLGRGEDDRPKRSDFCRKCGEEKAFCECGKWSR